MAHVVQAQHMGDAQTLQPGLRLPRTADRQNTVAVTVRDEGLKPFPRRSRGDARGKLFQHAPAEQRKAAQILWRTERNAGNPSSSATNCKRLASA